MHVWMRPRKVEPWWSETHNWNDGDDAIHDRELGLVERITSYTIEVLRLDDTKNTLLYFRETPKYFFNKRFGVEYYSNYNYVMWYNNWAPTWAQSVYCLVLASSSAVYVSSIHHSLHCPTPFKHGPQHITCTWTALLFKLWIVFFWGQYSTTDWLTDWSLKYEIQNSTNVI